MPTSIITSFVQDRVQFRRKVPPIVAVNVWRVGGFWLGGMVFGAFPGFINVISSVSRTAPPAKVRDVDKVIQGIISKLPNWAGRLHVVESFADLPQNLQDYSTQHGVTPDAVFSVNYPAANVTHDALHIRDKAMPQIFIKNIKELTVPSVIAEIQPPKYNAIIATFWYESHGTLNVLRN